MELTTYNLCCKKHLSLIREHLGVYVEALGEVFDIYKVSCCHLGCHSPDGCSTKLWTSSVVRGRLSSRMRSKQAISMEEALMM